MAEDGSSIHDRLYSLAQYLAAKRDEERSKLSESYLKKMDESQFKCSPKSAEMAVHREAQDGQNYGEFLYQETLKMEEEVENKLEAMREKQEEEAVAECTFSPELSDYARRLVRDEPVEVRLERLEREHRLKLEEMSRHAKENESQELVFSPNVSTTESRQRDFYQNVRDLELRKQLRLISLQQEMELEQGITHHPQISEYSRGLTREDGSSVFERLHREAEHKAEKLQMAQLEMQRLRENLSSRSTESVPLAVKGHKDEDVQDLLYQDAENRKIRRLMLLTEKEMAEQAARNERKISKNSAKLAKKRTENELRFLMERFDLNRDGRLDKEEFFEALKRQVNFASVETGLAELHDSERDLVSERIWRAIDPDGTGFADMAQWARFVQTVAEGGTCGMDDPEDALEQIALAVAHEFVMACLALKLHDPLPTKRQARGACTRPAAEEEWMQCTFKPKLDEKSLKLVEQSGGDRFEVLHSDYKEREARRRELLGQVQQKEMEECTFTPRINKPSGNVRRDSTDRSSFFEALATPDRSGGRRKTSDTRTTEELELEAHCTFAPTTTPQRSTELSVSRSSRPPSSTPRGFTETVGRLQEARKAKLRKQEEDELRFSTDKYSKQRTQKPFNFMTERRHRSRQAPLLFVDVNLGGGKSGRIGIHAGDDPADLARNFATAYSLDEQLMARLERLLATHVEQVSGDVGEDSRGAQQTPRVSASMRATRSPKQDQPRPQSRPPRTPQRETSPPPQRELTAAQRADAILREYGASPENSSHRRGR